jgi:hypothetical protein
MTDHPHAAGHDSPDESSTIVLTSKLRPGPRPGPPPSVGPHDADDPLAMTDPLPALPVLSPVVKPAPPRGTPTVTVLPVAAPPARPPAPQLLSAAGATVAPHEDPTACLNRGTAAPAKPPGPASAPPSLALPAGARPKLRVTRGLRLNAEYPLYDGPNFIGRRDDKPVDVDLDGQEAADRVWSSRQHAVITLGAGTLTIEDLNSLNGTFVNRVRVYPGQKRGLAVNDVVQVGTVQLKVTT